MEREHTGIPAIDRVIATILKEEEEEIEYTCCGDEVVGWVEDHRICPTCKEHI
mgnify:FL=1